MVVRLFFAFFLFWMIACNSDVRQSEQELVAKVELSKSIPDEALQVESSVNSVSTVDMDDALFGKFFNDRAEFYIIDNPTNLLFGKKLDKIVFYYLDDELFQTKYFLQDDVTNHLIKQYGKFRIKGFDPGSRMIMSQVPIVLKTTSFYALNPIITNYELRWNLIDKEATLRVDKDQSLIVYAERLPTYDSKFRAIQINN